MVLPFHPKAYLHPTPFFLMAMSKKSIDTLASLMGLIMGLLRARFFTEELRIPYLLVDLFLLKNRYRKVILDIYHQR